MKDTLIIGNGLIATAFKKNYISKKDTIIFASGVSNSDENDPLNFLREKKLLIDTLIKYPNKQIIYFSTILINYKYTPYYKHKKDMEEILKQSSKNYLVFRIPQLIGEKGNNNNLINYLVNSIKNRKKINIYNNVKRAIIDVDDIVDLVMYCEDKINCVVLNISGIEKLSVIDLSKKIGSVLNIKPNIKIQEKYENNGWTLLDSDIFKKFLYTFNIIPTGYTERAIKKYY